MAIAFAGGGQVVVFEQEGVEAVTPPVRGRVAKRQAITQAARMVFARDGYARAGIETIAAEAGVSTRTIYNHFDGKEQLFSSVIKESSTRVADALVRLIDDHLDEVSVAAGLEGALSGLARAWVALQREFAPHFALVRQMQDEVASVPRTVLEAWNSAGPQRVEGALARHLRALAAQGFVDVDEPSLAADHFLLLTVGVLDSRSDHGAVALDQNETAKIIDAGVRTFLKGYLSSGTQQ